MGDTNTNNSANNVDAVTALTNAATIRKLLRLPNEDGKTNFEIIQVRSISELANGHNCEVTIRVDLAFGHEGLPVPENERYSVRTETVRRIDLKEVAKLAGLEINDKQQYVGAATDVVAVAALLKANLTEDDITVSPIKDVMWVRAKPDSVGFIGMLTFAEGGEVAPVEKLPTAINATLSASEVVIGEKVTATIEVLPADAANKAITVVSSDPTIATVNADGTEITGVKEGNVTITYTSTAAPTVKAEKPLLVKPQPVVKPTGIRVDDVPATMVVGETANITYNIFPLEGNFEGSGVPQDPTVVSVQGNQIHALKAGRTNILFSVVGYPSIITHIHVLVNDPPVIPPTSLVAVFDKLTYTVGETFKPTVVGSPANASKLYDYISDNTDVVGNNENGFTALAPGFAILRVRSQFDLAVITDEIKIEIVPAPTFEAKFSFGDTWDSPVANYANAGDILNVVVRGQDLNGSTDVTLAWAEVIGVGTDISIDSPITIDPQTGYGVAPVMINSAINGETVIANVLLDGEVVTSTNTLNLYEPAVVPTTITLQYVPAEISRGNGADLVAELDVNNYTAREVVWSTIPADIANFTPSQENSLNVNMFVPGTVEVGTLFKVKCVVDGVETTSADIEVKSNIA